MCPGRRSGETIRRGIFSLSTLEKSIPDLVVVSWASELKSESKFTLLNVALIVLRREAVRLLIDLSFTFVEKSLEIFEVISKLIQHMLTLVLIFPTLLLIMVVLVKFTLVLVKYTLTVVKSTLTIMLVLVKFTLVLVKNSLTIVK